MNPGHEANRHAVGSGLAADFQRNLEILSAQYVPTSFLASNKRPPDAPYMVEVLKMSRAYDPRADLFRSKEQVLQGTASWPPHLEFGTVIRSEIATGLPYCIFSDLDPSLFRQPVTRPISQEQLVNEVKGIYAGLVKLEKKCVEIDNRLTLSREKLSHEHYKALLTLHRTLLHEHNDFFLASLHQSASPALKRLPEKLRMPARIWRHGIHTYLEVMRHRLPNSLDHMVSFIHFAFEILGTLKESAPAFEDIWIECLGDVARYRMVIEDEDLKERDIWSGIAHYWYSKAADLSPNIGRLPHHLAVLARPNPYRELFYYTKALDCVQPFLNTNESILTVFDPILKNHGPVIRECDCIEIAFVKAHGILFQDGALSDFCEQSHRFISLLGHNTGRISAKWQEQGVWIASANFYSVLRCRHRSETLLDKVCNVLHNHPRGDADALGIWSRESVESTWEPLSVKLNYTVDLTFSTFSVAVRRIDHENVLPHVHVSLVFLVCLADVPEVMRCIEQFVPWSLIVFFLNTIDRRGVKYDCVEGNKLLPRNAETVACLPEDFAMRGQIWSQHYYPVNFFDERPVDYEERTLERPGMITMRVERCLFLARRLASVSCLRCWGDIYTNLRGLPRRLVAGFNTIQTPSCLL